MSSTLGVLRRFGSSAPVGAGCELVEAQDVNTTDQDSTTAVSQIPGQTALTTSFVLIISRTITLVGTQTVFAAATLFWRSNGIAATIDTELRVGARVVGTATIAVPSNRGATLLIMEIDPDIPDGITTYDLFAKASLALAQSQGGRCFSEIRLLELDL